MANKTVIKEELTFRMLYYLVVAEDTFTNIFSNSNKREKTKTPKFEQYIFNRWIFNEIFKHDKNFIIKITTCCYLLSKGGKPNQSIKNEVNISI